MRHVISGAMVLFVLGGCAYPNSGVTVRDERPTIAIQGAPAGALLYVDGVAMGNADQFDGKTKTLIVEPGRHKIEVLHQGQPLLSEQVFLGAGALKIFPVHIPGAKQ